MTGSEASESSDKAAGEKHEIEHESPDKKRQKTDEKQSKKDEPKTKPPQDVSKPTSKSPKDDAIKPSQEPNMPSTTMEKGLVYFFIRGRVNIDSPSSVDEIARTFMLLRPIPKDARLGEGPLADAANARVLALPKKVFPTGPRDRFMAFVNMADASFGKLKEDFLASQDYVTKTAGARHKPQATPVAEGVYAMTSTGRDSHLAYMLTLPEELDEVLEALALEKQGSFIMSTKNPKYPGPANARLPKAPDFPEE